MRKQFIAIILFLMTILAFGAETDIILPSAASTGYGGYHAAYPDGLSTLFSNPAGLKSLDSEFRISELTIGLKGPVFDITGAVLEMVDSGDTSELTSLLSGSLYAGADIVGPLYFGFAGNGLGFGLFNYTDIVLKKAGLNVKADIKEQLILSGGYAFRIPLPDSWNSTLDAGVVLKGSLSGNVEVVKSVLEFVDLSALGMDAIMTSPFSFISSIGLDLGVRYSIRDVFSVGITGADLFTPSMTTVYAGGAGDFLSGIGASDPVTDFVPFKLNVGLLYSPHIGFIDRYITDIKFMLDYKDIFDFLVAPLPVHPLLHLSFGTELTLLEIVSVRAGFNEGLFAAGLGLDLRVFTLNMSMYGEELSTDPGLNPVYNVRIGFEFKI